MNRQSEHTLSRAGTKCVLTALALMCSVFLPQTTCYGFEQSQVSQFGITWTFDRNYVVGQFANGDYWVVGPATITGISPASVESDGRVINGSMVNPSPKLGRKQGYDSAMYGRYVQAGDYEPSLNVARPNGWDLSRDNPLVVNPNSSLVSTISTPEAGGRTELRVAAVLTVLDGPAPEGSSACKSQARARSARPCDCRALFRAGVVRPYSGMAGP
jgi:hypothetical protein